MRKRVHAGLSPCSHLGMQGYPGSWTSDRVADPGITGGIDIRKKWS